jgi:glycosyltransferase involved in cell wall biosynthesis
MKILLVSSFYGLGGGGSGIIAEYLARGMSSAGHTVTVLTLGKNRAITVVAQDKIRVYRYRPLNLYPMEVKDTHPVWQRMIWQFVDIYNPFSAHVLWRIMKEETPDVIHINKMRGFSGAVWSVSTDLFPGRVIQTCHDYESMSPDGLLRGSIGEMALNKKWPIRGYQLIRANLSSKVSIVAAPSKYTLDRILESGLFSSASSVVIPNTHGWSEDELMAIQKHKYYIPQKETRFLFIGRLEVEKGILDLCEAFVLLSKTFPSAYLDIAGSGTLEPYIREKYKHNSHITFLGKIDGQKKEEAFYRTTVVVVPSLVAEVFGIVTIEAFAFGKPVVASNIGGLPELVFPDETGWLAEPGNVQSLRDRLEKVINTGPERLSNIAKNCKESSIKFSSDKIVKLHEQLFSKLAG